MTEAFPWDTAPCYLLRDRDASYGPVFRDRVRVMGIKEIGSSGNRVDESNGECGLKPHGYWVFGVS
jgi:hypothetical protein